MTFSLFAATLLAVALLPGSARAQSEPARVLLVSTPAAEEPVSMDALARTLRAQLAGSGAQLERETATPDVRHERSRTQWGRDMARLHEVDAVTWIEPGTDGAAQVWLVDAREARPRARWLAVPAGNEFDMLRTIALSILSLLGRDVAEIEGEPRRESEAPAPAAAPSTDAPETGEQAAVAEREGDASDASDASADAATGEPDDEVPAAPPRAEPARDDTRDDARRDDARDDDGLAFGAEMGPLVRIGARAVPAWAVRGHLRTGQVVVELGVQLLREESWRTDVGNLRRIRRRVPLTLSLRAGRRYGPVAVEGGVGGGLTIARVEQHPDDDPAAAMGGRVLAAVFRFEVVARWAVAEDLYLSLPFTIALRAARMRAGEDEERPRPAPHMEVTTGLAFGLGRP